MAKTPKIKTETEPKTEPKKAAAPKTPRRRTPAKPPVPVQAAAPEQLPVEEVAAEAYFLFVARGGQHGDPTADWLAAEQIVRARRAAQKTN
jgi:hypothetical protein